MYGQLSMTLATPTKCSMNPERNKIMMKFLASINNETLVKVGADPLKLLLRNTTYSVRYTGPTNAILSKYSIYC